MSVDIERKIAETDWAEMRRRSDAMPAGRYLRRWHDAAFGPVESEIVVEVRSGLRCYCWADKYQKDDEYWQDLMYAIDGSEFIPIVPVAGESHEQPVLDLVRSREQLRELSCFVLLVNCEVGA